MTPSPATTAPATNLPATGAAVNNASAKNGGALTSLTNNFSDFLTLLMTQLKNQDPTSPMDTNQFTSQLVQFSSVEQQINTNSSLQQLIQLTQGGEVLQSSSLVGKPVQVTSDRIALQGGAGSVHFATPAAQPVSIGVYNDAGLKLRDAVLTSQPGPNTWRWDGKDSQGNAVPDGAYRTYVTTAANGVDANLAFTVGGTATAVQKSGNALKLQLGALSVDLSAVQSVTE